MKRIAFLLAIIFLVTSAGVFAQYETPLKEIDGLKGELISYLLSDKRFSDDEQITRGRFLEAVVTLISKNTVLNINGPYSDVEADTFLSYCTYAALQLNIIAENPTFNPDEEIKFIDALTIMVRALGYGSIAESMGGYPNGNRKLANNLGLTSKIIETETLNAQTAYTLLFNMMDCNFMLGAVDGGKTFFRDIYKIGEVEGIVNANEFSYLSDAGEKLKENRVLIGVNEYIYENGADLLGYYVKGFYEEEGGERRIIVLSDEKTTKIKFSGRDVKFDGNTITVETNGKDKKYKLEKSFDYLLGGKASGSAGLSALLANADLSIELIDNNSDGIYDVVSVDKWMYCHIHSIDPIDRIILDKNNSANKVDLSADECVYHIYKIEEDGITEVDLADLKPEMLIACSSSSDNLLHKIIVCEDERHVIINSTDNSEAKIYGDGEELLLSKYAQNYMNILLGTEYLILLGINGEAVVLSQASQSTQYGWIVDTSTERKTDTYKIKIFNQTGQVVTYTISEKIKIDGVKTFMGDQVTPKYVVDLYEPSIDSTGKDAKDKYRFVKFKTDAYGEVRNIDIPSTFSGTRPYVAQVNENDDFTLYFDGTYKYKKNGSLGSKFGVSGATVFVIPDDTDSRDDYDYYRISQPGAVFTNDDSYAVKAYDCAESSTPKVMLYFNNTTGGGAALYEMMPAVVMKNMTALDPYGDICTELLVECGGSYQTLYSNEKTEATMSSLKKGDIIRYSAIKNNIVTAISCDYRFEDDTILQGEAGGLLEYNKGVVYSYGNGVLNIVENKKKITGSVSLADLRCIAFGGSIPISFVYVTENNVTVRPTPNEKLTDYLHGGNRASYVVIRQRYDEGKYVIVYVTE